MLYPSIQELLKATAKDGEERLNKYSITMATAKCARMITNDYIEQRHNAERKVANKETDSRDISSLVKKEYREEKAVKNALRELKDGEYGVYLPGEEGYEDATVIVEDYKEPEKIDVIVKFTKSEIVEAQADEEEDLDSQDLMGATEVFDSEEGFVVEDAE